MSASVSVPEKSSEASGGSLRELWLITLGHSLTHWYPATFYLILPIIGKELGLTYSQIGLIMTCQYLAGAIANVPGAAYIDYFYFSIETLSTAGYGDMHPQSHYGHFIATVELFTGIFSMSLMTGLIFARFSRPSARLLFANTPVISNHDGKPTLMIRFANERHNVIGNATARLWLLRNEVSLDGGTFRRFSELSLVRNEHPALALSWTLYHVLDQTSPLQGTTATDLAAAKASLVVVVSGYDVVAAQTVHARQTYEHPAIRFGHRYADILDTSDDGRLRIDYGRFHDTVEG